MTTNRIMRNSKLGCLIALRNLGFHPSVVIDVGAQIGTRDLYMAFPDSKHLMIEPVEENRTSLMNIASSLTNAEVIIAAAYSRSGEKYLCVSNNFRYANIADEDKPTGDFQIVRKIPCIALDDLCRDRHLKGPFLIKIDVDGNELDVLEGMTDTLKQTECVIVETVFFTEGLNYFSRIVEFMKNHDFVIYDIVEPVYRPVDWALWQVDTVFVRRNGIFRQCHAFGDESTMKHIYQ